MSAQPLNSSISIFRAVRSYRQAHKHESVEAVIKHLRPLIMQVPGEEDLSGVIHRDTSRKDFSPYARLGLPVTVGLKDKTSFAAAQEGTTGVDFAFQIAGDKFLVNTAAEVDNDLYTDVAAVAADIVP